MITNLFILPVHKHYKSRGQPYQKL